LITTRRKTEKNAKKGKNLLFWTYRPKGPNEREKMNSKQIAQAIEKEQDRIDELEAEILEIERRIFELTNKQRIEKAKEDSKRFLSEHFKIIRY
jgi:hypothetical protein